MLGLGWISRRRSKGMKEGEDGRDEDVERKVGNMGI
jgi:hypothetical protein